MVEILKAGIVKRDSIFKMSTVFTSLFKSLFKSLSFIFFFFYIGLNAFHCCIASTNPDNATNEKFEWKKAPIDITDLPSLQRGFKLFMNHCSGCHGLQYLRFNTTAQDIGITDQNGKLLEQAVKDNLLFGAEKLSDPIRSSMKKQDGANWFGMNPPDLTLVTRARGVDWVYNYLLSFYPDDKKTWGVNNRVFPDVAMPHVLERMQKNSTPEEYAKNMGDIVNFLSYAGEPMQLKRKNLGVWVLIFLGLFTVFAALLKREYWKDVK